MADKKGSSGGASGSTGRKKKQPAPAAEPEVVDIDEYPGRTFEELGVAEAEKFLGSEYRKQSKLMTKAQRDILKVYKGNGYGNINAYLRHGEEGILGSTPASMYKKQLIQAAKYQAETLSSYEGKPLGRDMVLTRGMSFVPDGDNPLGKFLFGNATAGTLIGQTFTDKGFSSTSTVATSSFGGNVKLRIRAGKESKVIFTSPKGNHGGEREVILRPNSTFRVRGVEKTSSGGLILDVDLVQE